MDNPCAKLIENEESWHQGYKDGVDTAIDWMRLGHLRLETASWEIGKYPRNNKIRPWQITKLVWRSWFNEKLGYLRVK